MHRNSTWNGGWHLAVHNSGEPPNGHDFLLHRRHKSQPRELSLRLTAALFEDEGVLRDREADRALRLLRQQLTEWTDAAIADVKLEDAELRERLAAFVREAAEAAAP